MKKLLALVLALVMTLGLATVGTNAAFPVYGDADDFVHDEAIAVMSAVGVLAGFPDDGKFHPEAELTRAQAAKIVAYLLTNNKTADSLIGTGKYSDVPANHWAAGYIEFLSTEGVLDGDGTGKFYPDDTLKVAAFAKMLLAALGYNGSKEGMVGDDWIIYTTKLAADNKLFETLGDISPREELNREQAAQMALNAMKAPLVEYSNKGGTLTVGDATLDLGGSSFNYVTSTLASARNIKRDQLTNATTGDTRFVVEFAERQYPDLILRDTEDPFGRPANEWTYGKETIGTFVRSELLIDSWHVAVTGADFCNVLTDAQIKNSIITYKVNGKLVEYAEPNTVANTTDVYRQFGIAAKNLVRSNKIPYAFTGNGVLTEVYERDQELIFVSIYTYYAEVTTNYNASLDQLKFSVLTFDGTTAGNGNLRGNHPAPIYVGSFPNTVSDEDVPGVKKYKKDDKILVQIARNSADNGWNVITVTDPVVDTGVSISKFSQKIKDDEATNVEGLSYEGYIVTGGETKEFSKAVYPNTLSSYLAGKIDGTFDVVYDEYGFVIYTKGSSSSAKYVFIAAVDNYLSNLGVRTADAYAIFEDGTDEVITVNVIDTDKNIGDYEAARLAGTSATTYGAPLGEDYSVRYDVLSNENPLHAYNRWFSYSVKGEGANKVYTLTPAANSLMVKNGSAFNYTKADDDGVVRSTINPKSARVIGDYTYYNKDAVMTPNTRITAWGTESSKYVTVKTTRASAGHNGQAYHTVYDAVLASGAYQRTIAEVDTIYTGIQSITLMAYDVFDSNTTTAADAPTTNPFTEWMYVLYNNSTKAIKTAIVLGSDVTSTKNYIYAVSSAGSQWLEDGYDYWDFNAVVDGEEKVLTVKDEHGKVFGPADKIQAAVGFDPTKVSDGASAGVGGLFEVKYDKDGYVVDATHIPFTGAVSGIYTNSAMGGFNNTAEAAYATDLDGYKMYNVYFANGDTYRADGLTLRNTFNKTSNTTGFDAYETNSDIGLTIYANAPIYTVQEQRWPSSGRRDTLIESHASFRDALGALAGLTTQEGYRTSSAPTDTKAFSGYITAALDTNGIAKWVVIKNVGEYLDMNNNGGTSNIQPGATPRSVVLEDPYVTTTGFKINLYSFSPNTYVEVQLIEAGSTNGNSVGSFTVLTNSSGDAQVYVTTDGRNGTLKYTINAGKTYHVKVYDPRTNDLLELSNSVST